MNEKLRHYLWVAELFARRVFRMSRPTRRNWCCRDDRNLIELIQPRRDLVVLSCLTCGARHYTASVDPVRVGLVGASV